MAALTHAALFVLTAALGQERPVQVLLPGAHPSTEVASLSDGAAALALCDGVLRPVRLRISPSNDDSGTTEVRAPCAARLLVTGALTHRTTRIRPASAREAGEARNSPHGPLDVRLKLGQRRYRIDRIRLGSSGYRLTLEGAGAPVTLYECQSTDEARWELLWAGDLDGDGKLDLLIDAADAFDLSEVRLFLSRGAAEAVDEAALLRTTVRLPATP